MYRAYSGACVILPTKHAKSEAIAPPFREKLGASVLEYPLDTDTLGTFSGEVERSGSALECARRKCEWALETLDASATYCLASEGSFGPHPHIPFLACNQEILYFIDRKHQFHIHLIHVTENTNYQMKSIHTPEDLYRFADTVQFPSHAIIMRPNDKKNGTLLFKGIHTKEGLEQAFRACIEASNDGKAWAETDMRAHYNPSRMRAIGLLAEKLADRLASHCPNCHTPGWGRVSIEKGLPCEYCNQATGMTAHEIYGCTRCSYKETHPRPDGLIAAPQMQCGWCNP